VNRIFRVIWNAATRNWVVVSEIARTAVSKPGSIYVSGTQLSKVQAAPVATGRWKLSELATAFYLAGIWMIASPALAAPLKASHNPGTELASNRCGSGATATNVGGIAVGCGARAESGTIAILNRNNPFERRTDTIPSRITSGGLLEAQSIAIGEAASAGKSAIAVGGRSNAVDELATAMGVWARAQGKSSIAIGPRTLATGNTSLALGRQSVANADFAQAIGNVAAATGVSSLAVGHSATATGPRSIAIGGADTGLESVGGQSGVTYQTTSMTKATGIGSVALGGGAIATADRALALGDWAQATRARSVALGSGSNTDAVANAATQAGNALTQAGNAVTQAGNAMTQAANALTEAGKGWNLQANGDTASKVAPGDKVQFLDGTNINVTRNGNDLTIATAANLTADSLTINNGGPAIGNAGIAMSGKKITGLANGTAPGDAVNFAQLDGVKTTADNALTQAGGSDHG